MELRHERGRRSGAEAASRRERGLSLAGLVLGAALLSACAGIVSLPGLVPSATPDEGQLLGSYLAGRFAAAERDEAAALAHLARARALDPGNERVLEPIFRLNLAAGAIHEALELTGPLLEIDQEHGFAHLLRAVDALARGEPRAALLDLDAAGQGPLHSFAQTMLAAWATAAAGEGQAALAQFSRLADPESLRAIARHHAGLLHDMTGQTEAALAAYREALELQGPTLRLVDAYGSLLARTGRLEDARRLYEGFLADSPSNPLILAALKAVEAGLAPPAPVPDPRAGAAEVLYGIASAFPASADIELPLAYLHLAAHLRPGFALVHAYTGERHQDAEQWERAAEAFRRIDPASPLGPAAGIQIAYALDRAEATGEAIAGLERMIDRDPEFLEGILALADIHRARKRYAEAAPFYERAVALLGEPEPRHWSLFYARGTVYERLKRWPEAEASLKAALELKPEEPLVLNYLGYSWIDQGIHLEEGLALIRRAVELRPDEGFIIDSLGWAYYRLGRYDLAAKFLERAVELTPGDPTINDHLGDAFWKVGRRIEARFQWSHALALDPEEAEIEKIRRKLEVGLGE